MPHRLLALAVGGMAGCRRRHLLLLPLVAACGPVGTAGPGCTLAGGPYLLEQALDESSGVTVSRSRPGVFWSHNDGRSRLWALYREGRSLGRVEVRPSGAARFQDWEDLALGPCAGRDCLYIANIGDNNARREFVEVYRLPEPDPGSPEPLDADVLRMRYPEGPRDAEALFVVPAPGGEDEGELYIVSKGRGSGIHLFRHPGPLVPDTLVTLEVVQTFSEAPRMLPRQVTGASATPDGQIVAIRTYESLTFYRFEEGGLLPLEGGPVNLRTLQEPQGEAVGLGPGGLVALTSEGGPGGAPGVLTLVECRLPLGE